MPNKNYRKIKEASGIYKNIITGHYYAEKRIKGKLHTSSFETLYEAKKWRNTFNGVSYHGEEKISDFTTLKEVWETIQKYHFPTLATSSKAILQRRYRLWKIIEHLPMNMITPAKITEWVIYWVKHFNSDEYNSSGRGHAGRCNLNMELNLFVTLFNWYKESEQFEIEAMSLTNPVKRKHRKMGFIKPLPDKKKQIDLKGAFKFFDHLTPLYKGLAMMQFYTAGRIGEVAGLQWSNIDLENRRMLIKHTCIWDMNNKIFIELKPFPKNRETRPVYITDEIMEILKSREVFKIKGNDFVFHVEGKPINYCTVQINYREAQRKSGIPYSGTHILRHGMAKLARQVGGGLDAVLAMTGHKDLKLADHYSKCNEDDQKHFSKMIMEHIRRQKDSNLPPDQKMNNVIPLYSYKDGTND